MSGDSDCVFRELQSLARREYGGNTQVVLELYVHERFLARLSRSRHAESFVLKGGMLLAVMDLRRATRDADVLLRGFPLDDVLLSEAIGEIVRVDIADGVIFDDSTLRFDEIREETAYGGLRYALDAKVGSANIKLKLDMSTGDPVAPVQVEFPVLLNDGTIALWCYPPEAIVAEKVETVIARGDANTRMRDFADLYLIATRHEFSMSSLKNAIKATARYRGTELIPISLALSELTEARQVDWNRFLRQSRLENEVPTVLSEVVDAISCFVDPILDNDISESCWNPVSGSWEPHAPTINT